MCNGHGTVKEVVNSFSPSDDPDQTAPKELYILYMPVRDPG